jgi:hypothetical protein
MLYFNQFISIDAIISRLRLQTAMLKKLVNFASYLDIIGTKAKIKKSD